MSSQIPEKNTLEYSDYLSEIIEQLKSVKETLKRGVMRKEQRKEVDGLQTAIKSLRHLKNRNDRYVNKDILLNSREKKINENFGYDDIKSFFCGVNRDYDD